MPVCSVSVPPTVLLQIWQQWRLSGRTRARWSAFELCILFSIFMARMILSVSDQWVATVTAQWASVLEPWSHREKKGSWSGYWTLSYGSSAWIVNASCNQVPAPVSSEWVWTQLIADYTIIFHVGCSLNCIWISTKPQLQIFHPLKLKLSHLYFGWIWAQKSIS